MLPILNFIISSILFSDILYIITFKYTFPLIRDNFYLDIQSEKGRPSFFVLRCRTDTIGTDPGLRITESSGSVFD